MAQRLLLSRKVVSAGRVSFVDVFPRRSYLTGLGLRAIFTMRADTGGTLEVRTAIGRLSSRPRTRKSHVLKMSIARFFSPVVLRLLRGGGVLLDPHTVDVSGRRFTAQKILLAVGGRPFIPSFPGCEHVITSDEALNLPNLPANIVIVGGGFIALEFACIFALLGSQVSICIRSESLLRGFDKDLCSHLTEELIRQGIHIFPHTQITQITRQSDEQLHVVCGGATSFRADCVLYATGRTFILRV